MPVTYGDKHETLQPSELSDDDLLSVGRLVRAFTGIEELVTIYVCALAKIPQGTGVILLGKTALRRRLEMAASLAALAGDDELGRYKSAFPTEFFRALDVRNAVAHGIFLGADSDGNLSFLIDKTDQPEGSTVIQIVQAIHPDELRRISHQVANNVDVTAEILRLRSSLQKYRQPALRPHSKAQRRRTPSGKPKPPPRSSGA